MLCQLDILVVDFIRECKARDINPSFRDIQRYFRLCAHEDVKMSILRLQRAGLLHCAGHKGRRFELHNVRS